MFNFSKIIFLCVQKKFPSCGNIGSISSSFEGPREEDDTGFQKRLEIEPTGNKFDKQKLA